MNILKVFLIVVSKIKKIKLSGIITVIIFLLFSNNILSQELGISLGAMKNYSPEASSNRTYSFYPEISLSNNFFSKYLNWELAFGYLNDGLEPYEKSYLGKDYNTQDYILSPRLILISSKIFNYKYVPELIAGFSIHFVNSEYIYSPGPNVLGVVPDENETRFYFDIGAEYKITEIWGIGIIPRYMALIPLSNSDLLHNKVKHSFVLSFKY